MSVHAARGIAGSIALHGLVIVVITQWPGSEVPPRRAEASRPTVIEMIEPIAEVEPLAVVFLGDEPVSSGDMQAANTAHVVRPAQIAHAAGSTANVALGTAPDGNAPLADTAEPGGMLAMRGRRHDLALPGEAADRIAGARGPRTEQPIEPRWAHDPKIKLVPDGNGEYRVRDPVGTFRVAPDGTVDIARAPDITFKLNLPSIGGITRSAAFAKKRFAEWAADPYKRARVGPSQDLPRHLTAVPGSCDSAGDTMCFTAQDQQDEWEIEDEGLESLATGDVAGGRLDLTSYLSRKLGVGDVYASRKLKILDQTREQRVAIGGAFRGEQQKRAAELVHRNLEALWRTTTDPGERRAALFAMWDECSEDEGSAGEAGERARSMVIGWIRTHLPAGSPGAFTADEIAALEARRTSRAHFTPY